ncbi:hypothetical protein [Saccharothrix sp. ST-888]|uniref:hypothetical protein n=1 Tax=Saccharothrix sp. ST-888 TaxID=1427391 RepID=UPI000B1362BB|nr:hypothetical protein [Saccharothrix sp. ST-888]
MDTLRPRTAARTLCGVGGGRGGDPHPRANNLDVFDGNGRQMRQQYIKPRDAGR